jgi:1-acyl-sn-glycerol-3-phosphate acyltransferase
MVAVYFEHDEPTRRSRVLLATPLIWRVLMGVDNALVALTGRLEVTSDLPAYLRGRTVLLAANHVGVFDVFVLIAACRRLGIAPKFLATGGLFDAKFVGPVLRACGHVRVDRGKRNVAEAFDRAVNALRCGHPLLAYPEGRISRDPGLWPERGKSGVARIALAAGIPVVPVSQWGAHEAVCWGTERVNGWADLKPLLTSWLRAIWTRPVFRVHFGSPVDLSDLAATRTGDGVRARDRVMRAIANNLAPLRADEFDEPRFYDPTRPTDARSPWKPERP